MTERGYNNEDVLLFLKVAKFALNERDARFDIVQIVKIKK